MMNLTKNPRTQVKQLKRTHLLQQQSQEKKKLNALRKKDKVDEHFKNSLRKVKANEKMQLHQEYANNQKLTVFY